jgi:hypothetical protein
MRHRILCAIVVLIITGLLLVSCAEKPAGTGKIEPATLEEISGSEFKRVILTEKAAERLGIETEQVREEQVMRTRRVGGKVTASPPGAIPDTGEAGSSGEAVDTSTVWVLVRLSASDLDQVNPGQPVRILPITVDDDEEDDDDEEGEGLTAEPDEGPGDDDGEDGEERTGDALYFMVDNSDNSLQPDQRVFVELPLKADAQQRLIVPYAAVIYGLEGETWVYTNPEPLVYVRHPIAVDYIEDDMAVLSEGPSAGTQVVVVGVAELFGAETGVSK